MTVELTTLSNGLRIVSDAMPHLETVSLGLWVGVGARHEKPAQHGLSHFLEHMAFKGTLTRTARQIAEEIESAGGDLNAATSLETTAYYARVLGSDAGLALELLADILQNSTFSEEELVRERDVILQEIASIQDSPEEIAFDLVSEAAFPDQPVGRPIIGTPKSVAGLGARDLRDFLSHHYRPNAMVLAAAGAIRHEDLVRHGSALFGGLSAGNNGSEEPASYRSGGARVWEKPFEQSHIVWGVEAPSYRNRDFYTAQVFSGLLGGGMSSRLFQEVRETRGLCYAIYSSVWALRDTGMLTIHAATGQKSIRALVDVVGMELRKLASSGPSEAEMNRAKAQLKVGLSMALESSGARAEQMARQLLGLGRLLSTRELVEHVESITAEAVRGFAEGVLSKPPVVVLVGAGRKSWELAAHAGQLARGA